ncbi:hypothetical protein GGS23DRAFT_611765 [Durotheca rogersii]|uniref:uncharacterized protein n=1 Tax=Durotheca rogersii TaxID=419775 RepID=UPI00222118CE|nr:uncharacterized protein GGS23DRAFT_611765 [Durotheca rogersii]KAI5861635.1 hypothetical protein GGS23DRAFT_611765 [Durotheca rogersii]
MQSLLTVPSQAVAYYPPDIRAKFPEMFTNTGLSSQKAQYADIEYEFNEKKFLARAAAHAEAGGLKTDLPRGWPKTLNVNVLNHSDEVQHVNSRIQMPFHTDLVCDTIALLTVSCGDGGGDGYIASAWTVYNELAATRPDLINVLAEPNWPFDTNGRDPPFFERALLYFEDGKLLTNFSKRSLVGNVPLSPRSPGIPGLTEAQAEALDALHAIGRRHELKQTMEEGDIRFINNLALMHRRSPYRDSKDNYRHLLRLWLHNPSLCWKLPMDLQLAWERTFRDESRDEKWHFAKIESPDPPSPGPPSPDPTYMCD